MDQSRATTPESTATKTELDDNLLGFPDPGICFQIDPQSKTLEFERYLQVGGVYNAIARALHSLYNDPIKPHDPLGFIASKMSEDLPQIHEGMEVLYKEMIDLIIKLEVLIPQNQNLKRELLLLEALKDIEENPGEDGEVDN